VELTEVQESRPAAEHGVEGALMYVRQLPRRVQIAVGSASVVLAAACFVRFGLSGRAAVGAVFACVLVFLAAIDLQRRLIPNVIVLPALVFVLIAQIALFPGRTLEWILAALLAALFFFVPTLVYPMGMGMGDVKLAALLGAALGKSVAAAIFGALIAGAVFALVVLAREGLGARRNAIPYGPFLALGGVVVLLLGGR
jgi:leader peptidase (prepilin peptidase) / N-methyltransferase